MKVESKLFSQCVQENSIIVYGHWQNIFINIDKISNKSLFKSIGHILPSRLFLLTEKLFSDFYFSVYIISFFNFSLKFSLGNHRTRTENQLPKYIHFESLRIEIILMFTESRITKFTLK